MAHKMEKLTKLADTAIDDFNAEQRKKVRERSTHKHFRKILLQVDGKKERLRKLVKEHNKKVNGELVKGTIEEVKKIISKWEETLEQSEGNHVEISKLYVEIFYMLDLGIYNL